MFFHLQYIHLFRPFLKYSPAASPLPTHVSPRRLCTANATAISKLSRLYKKCWNMRQICNIAVYMIHSACTIHLLNLPDKIAQRDIIHGVKHLEEIANDWLCARRTLSILSVLSRKWNCDLPDEAATVLCRTDEKYGTFMTLDVLSPAKATSKDIYSQHGPDGSSSDLLSSFPLTGEPESHGLVSPDEMLSLNTRNQDMNALIPDLTCSDRTSTLIGEAWKETGFTQPLPSYPIFTPLPTTQAQNQVFQTSPAYHCAKIDGREWYLKDGVRWHQNFESWDLNSPLSTQPQPHGTSTQSTSNDQMFSFSSGSNTDHGGNR
jgi:hypothetical protein